MGCKFCLLLLLCPSLILPSNRYDDVSSLEEYFIKREGDILTYNVSKSPGMRSSALRDDDAKWKNGEVSIHFSPSFSNWEKKIIIDAMLEIHEKTCVRFRRVEEEDADFVMIIKPRKSECASMVGKQGGAQALLLSTGCFTRKVILHELMHALGFIHEHNRSDRDKYVTVKWSNIKEGEEHNFDKRKANTLSLMDTGYAYDSIMHYEGIEFSYNRRSPTLVPKNRVGSMGGDDNLSSIDVSRINKYYGCSIKEEKDEVEEAKEEVNVKQDEDSKITTTEAPETTEEVVTTMFAPLNWRRKDCPNPYEIPKAGGNCRWLIMRVAKDPASPVHYLHCLPSLKTSDIRCGEWKRKSCASRTVFDPIYRSCRPGVLQEEEEASEEEEV